MLNGKNIPKTIEIRGEVIIPISQFKKLNLIDEKNFPTQEMLLLEP